VGILALDYDIDPLADNFNNFIVKNKKSCGTVEPGG
jgi:hypothetical protein